MATIRELLIRGNFDPSGISRGLAKGATEIQAFVGRVNAAVGQEQLKVAVMGQEFARMAQPVRQTVSNLEDMVLNLSASTTGAGRLTQVLEGFHGSAAIGVSELARGIGKVAQAGEVGAFAMREFTGAGFRLAQFLGPAGPLIPVIALLGFSFYEMFKGARDEAEKTRKKFTEEFNHMVDALDQSGLRDQLRSLEIGAPSAGLGAGGGFKGSIRDLVARRNDIVRQIQELQASLPADDSNDDFFQRVLRRRITVLERYWRELGEQLTPLRQRQDDLRRALLSPNIVPGETTPAGTAPVTTKADSPTKAIEEQAAAATRLAGIYQTLTQRQQTSAVASDGLLRAYDGLSRTLADLHRQGRSVFDPLVDGIMKAQQALEQTDIVRALRLGKLTLAVPDVAQAGVRPFLPQQVASVEAAGTGIVSALLRAIERSGGVQGAATPRIDAGRLINLVGPEIAATFRSIGDTIKTAFTGSLLAAIGPVAVLMRALEPALRALAPLFDRLALPVALVARTLVASIEPTLRALWPILRLLGIVTSTVGEVMARVSAAIAQAVGGLIKAIGNLIAKIPGLGGVGHAIANFGQSILNYAQGAKEAADEFARTRHELQGMTWDGTAKALDDLQNSARNASDELKNIPNGFRIQRAIFLASRPVNAQDVVGTSGASGAANYFAPGSIVIVGSSKSGEQLLNEVSAAARQRAMTRTGTTADAARVMAG